MRVLLLFFLLGLCCQLPSPALAQIDGRIFLSADSVKDGEQMLMLSGEWKYHPGDDPAWASPEFDDSAWETASTLLKPGKMPAAGWPSIGWFRLHVEVDSTLWNTPLALVCKQFGASEIYLDGKQSYRFGRISTTGGGEATRIDLNPKVFALGSAAEHLIAVRHSNFSAKQLHRSHVCSEYREEQGY